MQRLIFRNLSSKSFIIMVYKTFTQKILAFAYFYITKEHTKTQKGLRNKRRDRKINNFLLVKF